MMLRAPPISARANDDAVFDRHYDLAFVGSGIACTLTLLALARRLLDAPRPGKPLQVAVIEKAGECWQGIAYGARSGASALVITALREFVDEPERAVFIAWLKVNQAAWLEHLRLHGGEAGARWIAANGPLIQAGRWEELFLPRFLYGRYCAEKLAAALELLEQQGLAAVSRVRAEAIDISRADEAGYQIALEDAELQPACLRAERVVLAIGSPPMNPIPDLPPGQPQQHACLNDIYCPSTEANLDRIHAALAAIAEPANRNLLILGSNASALEALYFIRHRPEIKALVNAVVIISRSGRLPYKIKDEALAFEFSGLALLKQKAAVSARELIAAIQADVQRAEAAGVNIADLFHPASALVVELFAHMDLAEQEAFFCQHGMTFTKLMRRAGREYREAADELAADGKLAMVKGVFRQLEGSSAGSAFVSVSYADAETGASRTHPLPFAVVVNCGGFEELNASSSRLVCNLVKNNVCHVNQTRRGFLVNERLEANRSLYVIGPLVGGNFNRKIRFWHVESAPRIQGLAGLLAGTLFESLSNAHAAPHEAAGAGVCAEV